jgi:hypothetical protein
MNCSYVIWISPYDTSDNVIFIMADDLGHECLGIYGNRQYRTPNLDRLASQGARFDHAFAAPLCTPTRVMLMTGKYNQCKDPLEETPATGAEAEAAKQKLQPVFAQVGATPESMRRFRDMNVRVMGTKRR